MGNLRSEVATPEAIIKALKEKGVSLAYGATAETMKKAFAALAESKETVEEVVETIPEEITEPVASNDKVEDNKEEDEDLTTGEQTTEDETSEEGTLEDETVEGDKEPEIEEDKTITNLLKGKKNRKRK